MRVSTEEQVREGYSIKAQIKTLKLFAQLYEFRVEKVYTDEGLSGKSTNRPGLKNLLHDAQNKKFDVVLIWKINRLSRSLSHLLNIVDTLRQFNVSFISQSETFNTATPVGIMTLQILGSIAEFERNTIVENIKLGFKEKASRGEWLGGKVYGYKNINKELVVDEDKAKVIREIFENFDNGLTIYKIVKMLNQKGYKTLKNKDFTTSSVRRILGNPIYCGFLRHNVKNKKEYFEIQGKHERIISQELFNNVQNKLKGLSESKTSSNIFLLSGLLKCPRCKNNLVRYTTSGYRYYRCGAYHNYGKRRCEGFLINAEQIEREVFYKIKELFSKFEIQKILYDVFNIHEIFQDNFISKFDKFESERKKNILRYFIFKIILTKNKNLKKIFFKNID